MVVEEKPACRGGEGACGRPVDADPATTSSAASRSSAAAVFDLRRMVVEEKPACSGRLTGGLRLPCRLSCRPAPDSTRFAGTDRSVPPRPTRGADIASCTAAASAAAMSASDSGIFSQSRLTRRKISSARWCCSWSCSPLKDAGQALASSVSQTWKYECQIRQQI